MKKVLIVSILSLLIYGVIYTFIHENTWSGFKYRFFLGALNGIVPFLIGTAIYHFVLKALYSRIIYLDTLLGQIILAMLLAFVLVILFIAADKFVYGSGGKFNIETLKDDISFILGAGITVSIIYYVVTNFLFKGTSA